MSNDGLHMVLKYRPISISPYVGPGIMAAYKQGEGEPPCLVPVVAMAVCIVRHEVYDKRGRFVRRKDTTREVCGITADREMGFSVCEDVDNFDGYVTPGGLPE